jgi:hypothetical protein
MNRWLVIVAVVGALVGSSAGYLWWGVPADRSQDELRRTQADLDRERGMRARLEEAVTTGTK